MKSLFQVGTFFSMVFVVSGSVSFDPDPGKWYGSGGYGSATLGGSQRHVHINVLGSIQVESTQNRGKYNTVYLVQDKTIVDDGERKRGGGVQ